MRLAAMARWAVVLIASNIFAVPIDCRVSPTGDSGHMDPLSRADWLLKITSLAEPALEIEQIETDPIRPWRRLLRGMSDGEHKLRNTCGRPDE